MTPPLPLLRALAESMRRGDRVALASVRVGDTWWTAVWEQGGRFRAVRSAEGWPTATALDASRPFRVDDLTGEAWVLLRTAATVRAFVRARPRALVTIGEA